MNLFSEPYFYFYLVASILSFFSHRSATRSDVHGSLLTRENKLIVANFGSWIGCVFLVCASVWGGNWYDGAICYIVSLLVGSIAAVLPMIVTIGAIIAPLLVPVCLFFAFFSLFA